MEKLKLKPTRKSVQQFYDALSQFKTIGVWAVRSAFQTLLEHGGRQFGWKLVSEVDGALVDEFRLTHGFSEAKDTHDDLGKEIKKICPETS